MGIVRAQAPNAIGIENQPASFRDLETLFSNVLSVAISLLAIVLFVMLIVGGFKFITAGNNPQKAEGAKNTITWAIAGIVLAACAYLIISLIANFTGQQGITNFTIYQNN